MVKKDAEEIIYRVGQGVYIGAGVWATYLGMSMGGPLGTLLALGSPYVIADVLCDGKLNRKIKKGYDAFVEQWDKNIRRAVE